MIFINFYSKYLEFYRRIRNYIRNPRKKYSKYFSQKIVGGNFIPKKDIAFEKYIDNNGNFQIDLIKSAFTFDTSNYDVAIDIGANTGLTCRPICKKYKLVFAIEPASKNRACIGRNQYPGLNNLVILPFAISDVQQKSKIRVSNIACGGNSLSAIDMPCPDLYEEVHITTLDKLFLKHPLLENRRIGLLKIDIQGLELNALKGGKEIIISHKPTIICEVKTKFCSHSKEITNYLLSLGYKKVLEKGRDIIFISR